MNFGFYINNLSDEKQISVIANAIHNSLNENKVKDIAVFFDNASPPKYNFPCATFNSCDLWAFSGNLIVFSQENLASAVNIVNDIKIYFYYGLEPISTLALMTLPCDKFICDSQDSVKEFKRIFNREPDYVNDHTKGIIQVLT
tara:strand:- start:74 stop:502 length:429 start_codon:yes stop_codon:yes gene_type:complete